MSDYEIMIIFRARKEFWVKLIPNSHLTHEETEEQKPRRPAKDHTINWYQKLK